MAASGSVGNRKQREMKEDKLSQKPHPVQIPYCRLNQCFGDLMSSDKLKDTGVLFLILCNTLKGKQDTFIVVGIYRRRSGGNLRKTSLEETSVPDPPHYRVTTGRSCTSVLPIRY